jgi:PBSX family phage portal protein
MTLGAEVPIAREGTAAEITKRNVNAIRAAVFGLAGMRTKGTRGERLRLQAEAEPAPSSPGTSAGSTQKIEDDPLTRLEREGKVVQPPFDVLTLAVMPENSTELGPCIDAMAVNIESFGWRLEPRIPVNEDTSLEVLTALEEERVRAENFFENACAEGESIEDLRDKLRRDLEATGNCYVEFIEVPGTGKLDGLNHLPAWTMRIGRADAELTEYLDPRVQKSVRLEEVPEIAPGEPGEGEPGWLAPEEPEESPGEPGMPAETMREGAAGDGEVSVRKQVRVEVSYELKQQLRFKRFRRYVQVRDRRVIWFKELGDPRLISCVDGHVVTREELTAEGTEELARFTLGGTPERLVVTRGLAGFPVRDAANPVRHRRLYCTRSPYGLPRYVGHLFSIFGSRAAEEINFTTFKNNNIPSLAITVSNGKLDDESLERIEEFVEAAIQGDDNYSKFLLLEAEPVMEGMRDPGSMKIEIQPLTKEQHTDALFVNYQAANDERTRRAWRFPPIYVGKSEDFTGKTIEASRKLGDEQVFAPERAKVDRFFTRDVLLRLEIAWSVFRSNSPNVTENAELVKLLASGEKTGGLTPRIARKLLSRVVNEDLGDVDADLLPPDQPFSLTLAQIMKTASASAAPGGGEPTSQGRSGLQVGGGGPRDRSLEPAFESADGDPTDPTDAFSRLTEMIRAEAATRFGGFVPPALDLRDEPEPEED